MANLICNLFNFNLLSGLIGAVIGGLIAGVFVWLTTKSQIKASIKMEENKDREKFKSKMNNLLGEMNENLTITRAPMSSGQGVWIRCITDMWGEAKGEIIRLPNDLQIKIRETYFEILRYNSLIEFCLQLDITDGRLNKPLNSHAEKARETLSDTIKNFEEWVKKNNG